MEIAHDRHDVEDVAYFASLIAIKQKRIDQLMQAQREQDQRDNKCQKTNSYHAKTCNKKPDIRLK
ncbi:hypothetical protein SARC_08066 [Sphaeroforma arctica JP610]|uniref:Uncharacterized protein n=1 Tax=Sphaeroforma arctica JP610 TaxID=667725 RepID=A0A0L0FS52_9EUKA|nr:hypothetical protein SARC_08066 [Sphaeroforma arctica JP610]KNC79539.1 hypothetical protein SARC_08066 [Sphaeroforma arctica JP610]|eukprot:XP_014153441.1 hypothetical protein SARC_08066 [Sphaeroforma arctica JP610]